MNAIVLSLQLFDHDHFTCIYNIFNWLIYINNKCGYFSSNFVFESIELAVIGVFNKYHRWCIQFIYCFLEMYPKIQRTIGGSGIIIQHVSALVSIRFESWKYFWGIRIWYCYWLLLLVISYAMRFCVIVQKSENEYSTHAHKHTHTTRFKKRKKNDTQSWWGARHENKNNINNEM